MYFCSKPNIIMNHLELIRQSFEQWYNANISKDSKVSIVANYSDEQTLVIRSYHKTTVSMSVVGIKDNMSYTIPLFNISENYNHGVTTEEEAKESLLLKLCITIFDYCSKRISN